MITQLEFDFMKPNMIQMEFDFNSAPSELIEVTCESNHIKFNYLDNNHDYLCEFNDIKLRSNGSRYACYKIKCILNDKLITTDSMDEFYLLHYYMDKYDGRIEYHKRLSVSNIDPSRNYIEPDIYIIDEDRYVEYHPNIYDGKLEYYKYIADKLNLNIEFIDGYDLNKLLNYHIIDDNIVKSPGFIYNLDNNTYSINTNIDLYTVDELIDLLISKKIKFDYKLLIKSNRSLRSKLDLFFNYSNRIDICTRVGNRIRSAVDYIVNNGVDRVYKLSEFMKFYHTRNNVCIDNLMPVINIFDAIGIKVKVKSKRSSINI